MEHDPSEGDSTRRYLVKREEQGIYVTDMQSGLKYFQTKEGGWFLLPGENSPFAEEVAIDPESDIAHYLSDIIATPNDDI